MKYRLQLVLFLLAICAAAGAQVEPAATGPGGPGIPLPASNLDYSIRYAQTAEFGGGLGDWQTSVLSGSLNYSNGKQRLPFTMEYGGGYDWTIDGPTYGTGYFQHFLVSQGMNWHTWNASVSDDVTYSPSTATFGFTGIPGIGEPIAGSNPAPSTPSPSVLALNTHILDNSTNATVSHNLNYAATLNLGGGYNLFRFPNGDGLDSNTAVANGGLQWRLDARNSLLGNCQFSQFTYPDLSFSFQTQSAYFGYSRIWSRRITTNLSAGPQWTSSSDAAAVPGSTSVAANASATYQSGYNSAGLSYSRGVNSGEGFLIGAETDAAAANYSRQFGREVNLGLFASYGRTVPLQGGGVTKATCGGAEVTRQIGRHLVVFANYSSIAQSSSSQLPSNVLGQFIQVIGFGIGYTHRRQGAMR